MSVRLNIQQPENFNVQPEQDQDQDPVLSGVFNVYKQISMM